MRYNTRAALITVLSAAGLAATLAGSVPASAVTADFPDGSPDVVTIEPDITAQPLCEANGFNYCGRDQNNAELQPSNINNANNTPGPAENTKWVGTGGTFTWNGHNYHTGLLRLTGHTDACWDDQVVMSSCDHGVGTVWGLGSSGGHYVFIARLRTQRDGRLEVLSSDNILGDRLFTDSWTNPNWFKRWSF